MLTADFDFPLPPERIALRPARPRDAARMLVVGEGGLADAQVRDLPSLLRAGDLLVFNDTRVLPTQLFARHGEAAIGVTLIERAAPDRWWAFVRNARRLKEGDRLEFGPGLAGTLAARREDGACLWALEADGLVEAALERVGAMPLPPYIAGKRPADEQDRADYQTVYAKTDGSVAAPTAGLHFTPGLLAELTRRGVGSGHLTLHVGAGTFQPVKAATMADHPMHAEPIIVQASLLRQLLAHRPRPVIAVGTTSLRTLESLYWLGVALLRAPAGAKEFDFTVSQFDFTVSQWQPYEPGPDIPTEAALAALLAHLETTGSAALEATTRLLIAPGYRFRVITGLITNFHQPASTLLLLVGALLGEAGWRTVYKHALAHDYRFLSYGDSSLLLP